MSELQYLSFSGLFAQHYTLQFILVIANGKISFLNLNSFRQHIVHHQFQMQCSIIHQLCITPNAHHSFIWLSNIPLCVCVCVYCIFIHSSIREYLGCFHNLAIMNNAPINRGAYIPLNQCFCILWVNSHVIIELCSIFI